MRTHDSSDAIGGRKRRRASRLVLINLLLILSLACSLPALNRSTPAPAPAPAPDASPQPSASLPLPEPTPLPPALVESQPVPGAEIPLTGPLKLYFNQPMDPRSVEEALSGQPALAGSFTWENEKVLVFQPERPFVPASDLTIQISSSARSKQGLQLINPLSISFRTVGFLHLTQALPPEGSPAVDPTTPVVASFNRPVFPLGFPGESQAAADVLSLDPPVEGRGEWINTSTYIFYPQPALAAGQTYTVQVSPDLHGLDGSPLAEEDEAGRAHPLRWTFTTSLPELLSIRPTGGIDGGNMEIPLDAQVVLTFSQAMDPQSIVESFALLSPAGEPFPVSLQENPNATTFVFTPDRLLDRSARYSAVLSAGARTLGGTPYAQNPSYAFYTVGPLQVRSSIPPPGGQLPPYMGITLEFSANLPPNGLDQYLTISPAVENMGTYLDVNQKTLQIYGSFAPETSYTLTVDSALQDAWGMSLASPYVLSFRTLPLDPSLSVGFGSEVLFLTPQDAVLPIQVVNLNSLAFTLGSVPLDDFLSLLGPNGYEIRQTYQPGGSSFRQQSFTIEPNRSQTVGLDLVDGVQGLAPGLYYVRLNPGRPNIYTTPLLLVVSRLQVTYKISPTNVLVWAVDLDSGSPAAGAPVAIYSEAGEILASGMTDSQGVYRSQIPLQQDMYPLSTAVVGSPGDALFGAALSHWNMGLSPWSFGIREDPNPPQLKTHLYTDRPIYRPGDVVYFKGLSRDQREGRYALPELSSQTLHLYNEMGEFVQSIDAPYTEFGTFSSQLYLPADFNPGQYRLAVGDSYLNAVYFQVAEYRKPEIELNVEVLQDEAAMGDQLQARIEAKYFFGAPASNLPVRWSIYAVAEQFLLDQYSVGPLDLSWMDAFHRSIYSGMYGDFIASGEAQTGPDGVLEIDFQAVLPRESRANLPFRFTLEVSLTDETAMPVLGRDSLLVHPASLYIGVKPDQFLVDAGSELGFAVQLVDWQKQPAGEHTLSASFQKVTWTRSDLNEYDLMQPQYQAVYEPVGHTRFVTGEDGVARLAFFPPQPGVYQLEVRSEDPALASAVTQVLVWAAGPGVAVWPAQPNQRLELTPDRKQYLPGDSAQVFIPNPFGVPVQALITIERSSILRHQVITLNESGSPVNIPLTAEDAPNVYLSAILLGRDGRGLPDFRFGLVNLPVEPVEQTLFVEILGVPDQPLAPGDSLSLGVRAEDASGEPVRAEFSLAVVDQAVLALAEPNAPPVLEAFYGEQPLGVRTGMSLAGYIGRLLSMFPGGGGGGEGMTILMVREDYQDTALWRADLVTDSSGEAWVTFSLPANLTGWQIEARGITQDSRVGQAQSEMQTVKDLFIRPVTPRFLVAGDYVQLAAVVHNNTAEAIQAEVVLQAQNVTLDNHDQVQTVLVPAAGRVRVEWWARVQEASQVDLIFSVSGAGLHDAARPVTPSASQERLGAGAIPVLRYTTRQTFSVSGYLDQPGERMELVSLPYSFSATGAALSLELSPSLAASLLSSLDPLERIPYESTEQLVSRLLPNLEMDQALAQLGTGSPELNQRLQTQLADSLRRLLLRQNLDGGWSWGPTQGATFQSESSNSDPYITAYVLYGLSRARELGADVDAGQLDRAVQYLKANMPAVQLTRETWVLDQLAFEHFALASAGAGERESAQALYEQRSLLNPAAQAFLALAFAKMPGQDAEGLEISRSLLSELQASASRSGSGVHWQERESTPQNFTTPVFTTAVVTYALAQRDPASPLLPEAVRYLAAHQGAGASGSVYEKAWVTLALLEYARGTGELGGDFSFSASVNGMQVAQGQAGPAAGQAEPVTALVSGDRLYPDYPNELVIRREAGPGRLYYRARLEVSRHAGDVPPMQEGFSVARRYYTPGEAGADPVEISSLTSGHTALVRLTLVVPQDSYYVAVEDFIPAGSELVETAPRPPMWDEIQGELVSEPVRLVDWLVADWEAWRFNKPALHDSRISWTAEFLPAGTYELVYQISALHAGEFRVLPARAWQIYFPEVQGSSAGSLFTITAGNPE